MQSSDTWSDAVKHFLLTYLSTVTFGHWVMLEQHIREWHESKEKILLKTINTKLFLFRFDRGVVPQNKRKWV